MLNVIRGATVSTQIIRSRKLVAEDNGLRSHVDKCGKRPNELRATDQPLQA